MSAPRFSQAMVVAELRAACRAHGAYGWAFSHGFSAHYIRMVLRGERDISEALANALGYVKQICFVQVQVARPIAAAHTEDTEITADAVVPTARGCARLDVSSLNSPGGPLSSPGIFARAGSAAIKKRGAA